MIKCLHILPMNKLSGAEKMALLICKNLKEYNPIVVCGGENLKNIFENENIKSYTLKFSNKNILKTLNGLKNIIKENNIKIIHAHDNKASLNAYLAKKIYRLDVKVISHIHSCYPFLKREGINKKIDSYFRKKYDYNIVCGNLVYNFYRENANYLKKEKTIILPNMIDVKEITNSKVENFDKIVKEYKLTTDKIILGFIGRICEIKGIIPFIKEFSKAKEKFSDCKILLIGSGDQEDEVKELIKKLQLEELFILTGFQNNVYKFYPLIDILFLPSLYEGLPMVLLEAMAFKKTIVSMDVGGINELIKDYKTGLLIEKENYKKFVHRLMEVKNDENLRDKISKEAFNEVFKNYDINNYINKLNLVYKKILNKKNNI